MRGRKLSEIEVKQDLLMKKMNWPAPHSKTFLIISFMLIAGFNQCVAQALVGKWKMVSTTTYFTAAGAARQGGKTSVVNPLPASASIISDFKADHTYLTTTSSESSTTPSVLGGTWSLSDNTLTVTVDPKYHPRKGVESSSATISISGNTMMITKPIQANDIVTKMVTNAERI